MTMAKLTQTLVRPVVTEKSTSLQGNNKFTFQVKLDANRELVKQAVEKLFEVKVIKVNIIRTRKKAKRFGPRLVQGREYKKAIVTLRPGDKITVFEGV